MNRRDLCKVDVYNYSGVNNYGRPSLTDKGIDIRCIIVPIEFVKNYEVPIDADVDAIAFTKEIISVGDVIKQSANTSPMPGQSYRPTDLYYKVKSIQYPTRRNAWFTMQLQRVLC